MNKLLNNEENAEVDELIANQPQGDRLAIKQSFLSRLAQAKLGDDEGAWSWLVERCCQPVIHVKPAVLVKVKDIAPVAGTQSGLF